jgi:hypothetical protein
VTSSANISKTIYLSNISEKINNAIFSGTTSPYTYNLDYSQSSVFYISKTPSTTGMMAFNLFNLPTTIDSSHSIIVSVIYNGTGNNYYANSVNVSNSSTPGSGTSYTPKFTVTPNISAITSSNLIVQQITYLYLGSIGYVISNVTGFGA